jgi:hypothetical protein
MFFGLLREASGAYAVPFSVAAAIQVIAGVVVALGRGAVRSPAQIDCAKYPGQ